MSSFIPLQLLSSSTASTTNKTISAITFSTTNKNVIYVGENNGKLSKIILSHENNNKNNKLCWTIDAKCGPIRGISISEQHQGRKSFIAVFGLGDSCVNVFEEEENQQQHQQQSTNVTLRWQCVGHIFSVTAATLLSSSSMMVITCSADGGIRLFDLQRASTCKLISSMSSPSIQQISALSQTFVPPSLNAIPIAVYSSKINNNTMLTETGNVLVWCEKTSKSKKKSAATANTSAVSATTSKNDQEQTGFLLQIDVLGCQRFAFSSTGGGMSLSTSMMNMNSLMNFSSSSSNNHNNNNMSGGNESKELLQILNITPLSDLISVANSNNENEEDSSSSLRLFSWNPKKDQVVISMMSNKNIVLASNLNNNSTSSSSMTKQQKNTTVPSTSSSLTTKSFETFEHLFMNENSSPFLLSFTNSTSSRFSSNTNNNNITFSMLKQDVLQNIESCLTSSSSKKESHNNKKISLSKILARSISDFYMTTTESSTLTSSVRRRQRGQEENEQEEGEEDSLQEIVDRCKETSKLISELSVQ